MGSLQSADSLRLLTKVDDEDDDDDDDDVRAIVFM